MKTHHFEAVARMCHEANRIICIMNDDFSQDHWEDAPSWQKESAIMGVRSHVESDFKITPEGSHISWMKEKEKAGWIYGDVKDPLKKTHPCMVPYDQLPEHQKLKDKVFTAIIHGMKDVLL